MSADEEVEWLWTTRRGSRLLNSGIPQNGSEAPMYLTVHIIFEAFKRWTAEIKRTVAVPPFRWQEVVKIMAARPPSFPTRLFRRGTGFGKQFQVLG
jgi:hypothetical protein